MKDFSVKMALVDAVPVILFSVSLIRVCRFFDPLLFIIGASLIIAGGLCKVIWKFILGLKKRNVTVLNKLFVPFMGSGFLTAAASLVIYRSRINFSGIISGVTSWPCALFLGLFAAGMLVMIICASRFKKYDAKDNWRAQFVNIFVQAMLLAALFTA